MKQFPALTLPPMTAHGMSVENYFLSPKMPVKDHINAFRCTKSSFQVPQPKIHQKSQGVLQQVDVNYLHKNNGFSQSLMALNGLNLLKPKNLHVINHMGADKSLSSNTHTRQTNAGYSRNTLGGIYTK